MGRGTPGSAARRYRYLSARRSVNGLLNVGSMTRPTRSPPMTRRREGEAPAEPRDPTTTILGA